MKFIIDVPGLEPGEEEAAIEGLQDALSQIELPDAVLYSPDNVKVDPLDFRMAIVIKGGMLTTLYLPDALLGIDVKLIDHDNLEFAGEGADAEEVEEQNAEDLRPTEDWSHARARQFRNHYQHEDCPVDPGIEWEDTWSCACNDRCPSCNAEIEPYESEELS